MSEKCPSCGSCGMPMEKPEQFGANDTSNAYCVHCTNDKGELFDYDTILKGKVIDLLGNNSLRARMAQRGREQCLRRFSGDKIMAETMTFLTGIHQAGRRNYHS